MKKKLIFTMLLAVLFIGCKSNSNTEKQGSPKGHQTPMLPCKEFKLIGKAPLKRKAMKEALNFFLSTNCFINNHGIFRLFVSFDTNENEVWSLYSTIEDRHIWGASITPFFEVFDGDIVLIYKKDYEILNKEMSVEQKNKICACTDKIIGNRVYKRPTRKDRWTNEYLGPNNPNPQGVNRASTGTACKIRFIFNNDASDYKIIKDFY